MDNPDFKSILLTRHGANDTLCVSAYKSVNGRFVVSERFCDGVEAAARLIERSYLREDIGAIWTNIQRLKPGSDRRKKGETIDAYTNFTVDIDRRDKKDADGNKVNATDAEREALRGVAEKIAAFLSPAFGPCVFADSGNGYHLNWKLADIKPGDGQRYYRDMLELLKRRFETPDANVEIDASLSDDTQVVTVWGTWNRKYADQPDRPQRQSKALLVPLGQEPIRWYDLEIFLTEHGSSFVKTQQAEAAASRKPGGSKKADPEWLEDFGVPDLIDFWSPLVAYEEDSYDKGGDTHHPIAPCPCHENEDFHNHSNKRDCEIIEFADGGIGISCFSGELSLKQVIAKMNAIKGETYPHRVFAEESDEEVAKAFGAEEASSRAAATSKPEEEASPLPEEGELKYPDLLLPFDEICKPGTKLRELAEAACRGGNLTGNKPFALSPGFVVPAILTLASAVPERDEMLGTRISLFCCLLSMSRAGKDVSWSHGAAVMGMGKRGESEYWTDYRPGGHSQMISLLGDTRESGKDKPTIPGPSRKLGLSPELGGILKSARGEGSHMLDTFNEFFDSNFHTTHERNTHRLVKMDCRFSWGTSLAIGIDRVEERRFSRVFGDSANDGFAQRFVFGFSETAVKPKDLEEWSPGTEPEPEGMYESLCHHGYLTKLERHEVLGYAEGVRERYIAEDIDFFPGCAFLFKKAMLLIACVNLHEAVTMDDFDAALAFIKWQARIREVFRPSQAADTAQAQFQEMVLRAIRRAADRNARLGKPDSWINVRRLARMNGWALDATSIGLERTIYALMDCGEIELMPETDDDGDQRTTGAGKLLWNWHRVRVRGRW